MLLPSGRDGTVEDGGWCAAAESIAVMRPVDVVEAQEVLEAAVQRRPAREVMPAKDDAPVLGEDRLLLVDRPSTHSLTNPRAVERYLDEMTLQHALILADK